MHGVGKLIETRIILTKSGCVWRINGALSYDQRLCVDSALWDCTRQGQHAASVWCERDAGRDTTCSSTHYGIERAKRPKANQPWAHMSSCLYFCSVLQFSIPLQWTLSTAVAAPGGVYETLQSLPSDHTTNNFPRSATLSHRYIRDWATMTPPAPC